MVHISLAHFVFIQSVQLLLLGERSQRTYIADLGLSPSEHGGTMNSGDQVNLCRQRTDLGDLTAVRALAILQNHLAHGLFLILVNGFAQHGQPLFLLRKSLLQPGCDLADVLFPGLFVIGEHGHFHLLGSGDPHDLVKHLLGDGAAGIAVLGLAHLGHDLVDEGNDSLVDFMGLVDGFNHPGLRHFVGAGLNHDHLLPGGRHGEVQISLLPLLLSGIDDEFPVNHSHLGHGTGTVKGDVRDAGGDGSAQHGHQFRTACGIHAHHHIVQGHVIAVILGKQGTHGSVDHPAGQHCVLTGLSFPLVETSGDLAHGIQLLLKLHTQGEEINALPGLFGRRGGTEHRGLAIMHKRAAVSLFTHSVDVHGQSTAGQFH